MGVTKMKKQKCGINKIMGKIVRFINRGFKYAVPILAATICEQTSRKITDDLQYTGELDYGDAVSAISMSEMYSTDKAACVPLVKANESSAYYKAIVAIARDGSMFSCDKRKAIVNITKSAALN